MIDSRLKMSSEGEISAWDRAEGPAGPGSLDRRSQGRAHLEASLVSLRTHSSEPFLAMDQQGDKTGAYDYWHIEEILRFTAGFTFSMLEGPIEWSTMKRNLAANYSPQWGQKCINTQDLSLIQSPFTEHSSAPGSVPCWGFGSGTDTAWPYTAYPPGGLCRNSSCKGQLLGRGNKHDLLLRVSLCFPMFLYSKCIISGFREKIFT